MKRKKLVKRILFIDTPLPLPLCVCVCGYLSFFKTSGWRKFDGISGSHRRPSFAPFSCIFFVPLATQLFTLPIRRSIAVRVAVYYRVAVPGKFSFKFILKCNQAAVILLLPKVFLWLVFFFYFRSLKLLQFARFTRFGGEI